MFIEKYHQLTDKTKFYCDRAKITALERCSHTAFNVIASVIDIPINKIRLMQSNLPSIYFNQRRHVHSFEAFRAL